MGSFEGVLNEYLKEARGSISREGKETAKGRRGGSMQLVKLLFCLN